MRHIVLDTTDDGEVIRLRQRVSDLEFELKQLRAVERKTSFTFCDLFRLTPKEGQLLAILYGASGTLTKEQLYCRIYGHDYEHLNGMKILDVYLSRIRKRLPPDIVIETRHGVGHALSPESRNRLRMILAAPEVWQIAAIERSALAA